MIERSITTIFWQIDEPSYRQDPALSQSSISAFERNGFECLSTLFEPFTTPSLGFGSAVDCYITDGEKAFSDKYFISDMPKVPSTAEPIVKDIYAQFCNSYTNINDIPDTELMPILSQYGYKGNTNWGVKAKCDAIRKDGAAYYQTMFMAKGKIIMSQENYTKVFACVRALKDSPQTKMYFCPDDPYGDIERVYQQKFKTELSGVMYRGMADLLIVDHKNKVVIPCDLKTSHNREYNFPKSFIEFRYDIQARLYWRIIRKLMDQDDYFKDFKLLEFRFIVVNNIDNPIPLVWSFRQSMALGEITVGNRVLRDPETIGKELRHYLDDGCIVPDDISMDKPNSIEHWFEVKR